MNRRILAVGLGLGLGVASFGGEVTMTVRGAQGLTGSATVVNRLLEDGSKYVRLTMELQSSAGKVSVLQESVYDKAGRPVRKIQQTNLPGDAAKQSVLVTFGADAAELQVTAGGKTVKDSVAMPAGRPILARSEFWFIKDRPAPGGINTYWRFDLGSSKWVETKVVYRGRRDLSVGGKTVLAHLMEYEGVKAYMDDQGDPLKIETGTTVMERKW